jgi:hypothetical protein
MQNQSHPNTTFMHGLSRWQQLDSNQTYAVIHRKHPVLTITTKHIYT